MSSWKLASANSLIRFAVDSFMGSPGGQGVNHPSAIITGDGSDCDPEIWGGIHRAGVRSPAPRHHGGIGIGAAWVTHPPACIMPAAQKKALGGG
jgi:hypothetical protein